MRRGRKGEATSPFLSLKASGLAEQLWNILRSMRRRQKKGTPGSGFLLFMAVVLVFILILLLIVRKYKQINPMPHMERKGVALFLHSS